MFDELVMDGLLDTGSDNERRHADTQRLVRRAVSLKRDVGRVNVVKEPAVLVVDEHEQGVLPAGAVDQGVVELEDERLAGVNVRRRVVIVGSGQAAEVDEVRVDPREGR